MHECRNHIQCWVSVHVSTHYKHTNVLCINTQCVHTLHYTVPTHAYHTHICSDAHTQMHMCAYACMSTHQTHTHTLTYLSMVKHCLLWCYNYKNQTLYIYPGYGSTNVHPHFVQLHKLTFFNMTCILHLLVFHVCWYLRKKYQITPVKLHITTLSRLVNNSPLLNLLLQKEKKTRVKENVKISTYTYKGVCPVMVKLSGAVLYSTGCNHCKSTVGTTFNSDNINLTVLQERLVQWDS